MSNGFPGNHLDLLPELREGVMPRSSPNLNLGNRERRPVEGANMFC